MRGLKNTIPGTIAFDWKEEPVKNHFSLISFPSTCYIRNTSA